MRRTYKKKSIEKINNQILVIGIVFVFAVAVGAYLNKIWTFNSSDIFNNISPAVEYYSSDIASNDAIISNLKSDVGFMATISIFALLVVTAPLVAIIFILKGVSIGYTINSCILGLQFKSIKMILIMLLKNIIIIPGAIILIVISLNYIREIISSLKKNNKENILFLGRRYLLNGVIVSAATVVLQLLLNTIGINIIKFLVR